MVRNMVYYMTMFRINIHDVKANLSRHLDSLAPGESLLVCRRNVAVAELRKLRLEPRGPRQFGGARGLFTVPETFFEPLSDEDLAGFSGG
jgi:antitoxin (DNA-binding transcriptional repressor) of toxin-antitoxin stability system